MKKLLLLFSFCNFAMLSITSAQIIYPTTTVYDSTTFTFSSVDSLQHIMVSGGLGPSIYVFVDTAATTLWRIGTTHKLAFMNDTLVGRGIMTDTVLPYPPNANDFFSLKMINSVTNFIVDIWHRYKTNSIHAGGIIEYSTDTGLSWMNIGNCPYVLKQNLYSSADTIYTGEPAFKGNSGGEQLTRFQFINCVGLKTTNTTCSSVFSLYMPGYIRFRFVSDSTIDSLSGWIIDSIRIEDPGCIPGSVAAIFPNKAFKVFPNPSTDGEFYLPELANVQQYTIEVYNAIGNKILNMSYQTVLNLSSYPKGLYHYVVTNGNYYYKGSLIFE